MSFIAGMSFSAPAHTTGDSKMLKFMARHKILSGIAIVILVLFLTAFAYVRYKMQGSHRE